MIKELCVSNETAVTIGNFDGVHLGHKSLIKRIKTVSKETGLKTALLTFTPHPKRFFNRESFSLITTDEEKALIIDETGIDYKIFLDFDEGLSRLSPGEFIENILVGGLKCRHLTVGENFMFGRGRAGNALTLKELCAKNGIVLDLLKTVQMDGARVSSERIRGLLCEGGVGHAAKLLGEPYFILSEIVRGRGLGKTLGFPTINQKPREGKLLPKNGVYFTKTYIDGKEYGGVTNVGVCPTLERAEKTVETFLLGLDGDVYGRLARVMFIERRRDERRFGSPEELKEAVMADIGRAGEFFNGYEQA